jgi:hypothetical protein
MRVTIQPVKLGGPTRQKIVRTEKPAIEDYRKGVVKRRLFQPYEDIVVKALNPNPTPGQQFQDIKEVTLSWTPGKGTISNKVYFAKDFLPPTTQPAAELVDQSRLRRENLSYGTYVWRVDTEHEDGLTKGDEWRFTIGPKPKPPEPGPIVPPVITIPPPVDGDFIVGRVLSSPLSQQVVLEDRRNPQNVVDKRVEIGQPLFDGTLVFIHPRGAVSEKTVAGGQPEWRFHPLGEAVRNMKMLNAQTDRDYGDIRHEVLKLKEKLAGITERPLESPGDGG